MTWYADGSPCTYFSPEGASERLVAIGWLDGSHAYERGRVEPEFETKLRELVRSAWEPAVAVGGHDCELWPCTQLPDTSRPIGSHDLFVPTKGSAYAAPELIVHYISEHEYLPPEAFRVAVMDCPPMSSDEYLDAMSENGPSQWLVDVELERIRRHEPETEAEIFRQRDEWSRHLDDVEMESRFRDLILSEARRLRRPAER